MAALRSPSFWLPLGLLAIIGALPLVTGKDSIRETVFGLLLFLSLAGSLNIMVGYTGYVSFGHIVFFGLGGYTGFYLIAKQGWSLYVAAMAGGLAASVLALLLGLAILRLRGAYFALATIGINEAARAFVGNFPLFGGPTGLAVNFSEYQKYGGAAKALWTIYGFMFVVAAVVLAGSWIVKHSRFGLGLMSIREDEDAAMVMGVRTPLQKTLAYVLSAFVPGVVGTIFFFKNGNVEPGDAFSLHMSIEILVIVMLGGQGTVLGALVGAGLYERLRGVLITTPLFKDLHLAIAGLILLLIVLFIPAGLVGWIRARVPFLRRVLE